MQLPIQEAKRESSKGLGKPVLSPKSKAIFLTLLAGILWGTSFPVIKIGLAYTDPFAFVFWRFLVSSLSLLLIMLFLRKLEFKIPDKRLLIFLGIANGVGYVLQYVGMNYATAAQAALFINLSAMWVALLSPRLLGETFSRKKILGVLFGLVGIVFVSTNLDFSTLMGGQLFGDALLLTAGATWALFMIYNKKFVGTNSTSATFQSMTWVLLFTAIFNRSFLSVSRLQVFCFIGASLVSGFLHCNCLLDSALLSLAGRAQASFGIHFHGSASIGNCNGSYFVNCRFKGAYYIILKHWCLLHCNCHCFGISKDEITCSNASREKENTES